MLVQSQMQWLKLFTITLSDLDGLFYEDISSIFFIVFHNIFHILFSHSRCGILKYLS